MFYFKLRTNPDGDADGRGSDFCAVPIAAACGDAFGLNPSIQIILQ